MIVSAPAADVVLVPLWSNDEPVQEVGILSRSVSWYLLARGCVPARTD